MERTGRCSRTLVSTEKFATVKVKGDFLAWLRRESLRRGVYLYELLEEVTARTLAGRRPWRGKTSEGRGEEKVVRAVEARLADIDAGRVVPLSWEEVRKGL